MTESSISAAELIRRENEELAELKGVLGDAVNQRGRFYNKTYTFSVTFEADNTSAARDTQDFQHMLKMLGLPKAFELVLEAKEGGPGWVVGGMLRNLAKQVDKLDTCCLIIGHYAGHARVNDDGDLAFYASDSAPRAMMMSHTFQPLYNPNEENFRNSDVILILDCCFAGTATRGVDSRDRSVEIIASVGYDQSALGNPSNLARIQNRTFTSRLADEVAKRVGRGDVSTISFAEVVDELRRQSSPDRLPQYCLRLGRVAVRIPIPSKLPPHLRTYAPSESSSMHHQRLTSSESSAGSTAPISQPVFAVFKVHLPNSKADSTEVFELVQWIHSLNPNIGLEINGVFMGRSTELMFMVPWVLWAQLAPRQGFSLICETFGPNQLPGMLSYLSRQQQQQRPQSSHPTGPENVPFGTRSSPQKPDRPS